MSLVFTILGLVAVSGVVSLILGTFVRRRLLATVAAIIITELIVLILLDFAVAGSPDAPDIVGMPAAFAVVTAPVVLLTSIFSVRLASQWQAKRST